MRKLIIFLYFVFLFKLAFAQSLPSIPSLDELRGVEPAAGEQQLAQVPDMPSLEGEDELPSDLDLPVTDNTVNVAPAPEMPAAQPDTSAQIDIEAPALDMPASVEVPAPSAEVAAPVNPDEFEAPALPPTADSGATAPVPSAEVQELPKLPDQTTTETENAAKATEPAQDSGSVMDEIISESAEKTEFPETPDLDYEKNKKAAQGDEQKTEEPTLTAEDREKEVDNLLDQVFDKGKTPEQLAAEKAQEEADIVAAEEEKNARQSDSPLTEKVVDVNEQPIQPIDDLQTDDDEQMALTELPASMKDDAVDSSPFNQPTNRAVYTSSTYSEQQLSDMLVKASMRGDKNTVVQLIHSGRSPNAQNMYGETPLMGAVYSGQNQIVEVLLSEGADANVTDNKGNSSLLVAAAKNNVQAVQQLIRGGADIDLANNASDTPLLVAVLNNNKDVADILVRQGANINKSNADGMTPLHIAAYNGNSQLASYLLSVGANPNVIAKGGLKPANLAKNNDVAQLLESYTQNQQKIAEANKIASEIKEQTNMSYSQQKQTDSELAMFPSAYVEPQQVQPQQTPLPQSNWWAAKNEPVSAPAISNAQVQNPASVEQADYSQADNYSVPASIAYKSMAAGKQVSSPVQYQAPVEESKKWTKLTPAQNNFTKEPALAPVSQQVVNAQQAQSLPVQIPSQPQAVVRATYDANGNIVNVQPQVIAQPQAVAQVPAAPVSVVSVAVAPQQGFVPPSAPASMKNIQREVVVNTYIPPVLPAAVPVQQYQQPVQQIAKNAAPVRAQYNAGPISNNININVPRYADLDPAKQAVWDMKLAEWVKEGVNINAKSEGERIYWMKQQRVLQAVYQEQFNSKVESVKKRMSSTGINFTPAPEKYSGFEVKSKPVKLTKSSGFNTTSAEGYVNNYQASN
jgi:ankyrin repeat protein